jgi:hypothetical protein
MAGLHPLHDFRPMPPAGWIKVLEPFSDATSGGDTMLEQVLQEAKAAFAVLSRRDARTVHRGSS